MRINCSKNIYDRMINEITKKICEVNVYTVSELLGKYQNIFHLKVLFENIQINGLFTPAVLIATEESNFSLKKFPNPNADFELPSSLMCKEDVTQQTYMHSM